MRRGKEFYVAPSMINPLPGKGGLQGKDARRCPSLTEKRRFSSPPRRLELPGRCDQPAELRCLPDGIEVGVAIDDLQAEAAFEAVGKQLKGPQAILGILPGCEGKDAGHLVEVRRLRVQK